MNQLELDFIIYNDCKWIDWINEEAFGNLCLQDVLNRLRERLIEAERKR